MFSKKTQFCQLVLHSCSDSPCWSSATVPTASIPGWRLDGRQSSTLCMLSVCSICCASCHLVSSVLEMLLFTPKQNAAMLPVMGSAAPPSWKTLSGYYQRIKGEQVGAGPSMHRWQCKHHHLLSTFMPRCYWRQGLDLALLVRGSPRIYFGGLLLTLFFLPYNRLLSLVQSSDSQLS